jgi:outer membrane protein TolC
LKFKTAKFLLNYFVVLLFLSTNLFPQSLSLREAVNITLRQNETIRRYKAKVEEKDSERDAAFGNYLPKVTLLAGYTYMGDNIEINMSHVKNSMDDIVAKYGVQISNAILPVPLPPDDLYNAIYNSAQKLPAYNLIIDQQQFPTANLAIVQPLFTGGKISAGSNFAEAEYQEASIEVIKITNETIQEVANIYLGVVLLEQVVETRKDVVEGIKKHKTMAEKLVLEGIISKYHVLRAKVALADAEYELEDDKNNLSLAQLALASTLGFQNDTTFILSDKLIYENENIELNSGVDSAYSNQPILKLIEQKKMMVDQKRNVASSNMWPTIFAFGEVGFFREEMPGVIQPPWIVGVQMKYEIFSGMKDYNEIQSANHLQNQLTIANRDAKNKIKLWVNKSFREINNAKVKYEKLEPTIVLAEESLRMASRRFEEGYGTSLEVVDANLVLEGEKVKRLATLYNYYKSITEFYLAIGEPIKAIDLIEDAQQNNLK